MGAPRRGLIWETLSPEQIVLTYYDGPEPAADWPAYFALLSSFVPTPSARFLVLALASPPPSALEGILRVVRGKAWQVALISPSAAVRFAASTFTFAIRTLRFFSPDDMPGALQHLGCTPAERTKVLATLERMRGPEPR